MLQHAGTALSQHASRAMVRFSEHCELCAGCPSLNHSTVHRNRSSRHHSRSSREVRETHLSWCGGPSIILGSNELGLFSHIFAKSIKSYFLIKICMISASSGAPLRAAHLTVLYTISKFTTYTHIFERPIK